MVQTHFKNKRNKPLSSAKGAPSKTACQSSFSCYSSHNAGKDTWQQLQKYVQKCKKTRYYSLFLKRDISMFSIAFNSLGVTMIAPSG